MDIYNALGFAAFGAIDLLLYFRLKRWFPKQINSPWPWLAVAKLGAIAAGLAGVRSSADVGVATLAAIWFGGGAMVSLVLWINHRPEAAQLKPGPLSAQHVNGRIISWCAAFSFWFMAGSFFAAFGCLAIRATLAPDLATVGTSLLFTVGAAAASFVAAYVGGMVYDNVVNLASAR